MIMRRKTKNDSDGIRVVITGGVTGGHLFPGIALAEEFMARDPNNDVRFVSIGNDLEKNTLSRKGFPLSVVSVKGIKGKGLFNQMKTVFNLPRSLWQALGMIRTYDPHLVVSVGSFAAGPATFAAWMLRKKIVLCEQNIIPGITNRMLSRFARRVYVSFEETREKFDASKVKCFGNPVRSEFFLQASSTAADDSETDDNKPFTILVVGGSQGAHNINMSVIEGLGYLNNKDRYQFVHQTGEQDVAIVKDAYDVHGVASVVKAFFDDMGCRYKKADLVICRSGATTVAELTAMGKTAVFIPFPHAADDHQYLNAKSLAEAGAAEMIPERDLTGEKLAEKIQYYAQYPDVLAEMARKAKAFGHPEASKNIVQDCYELLEENSPMMLLLNFIMKE